MFGNIRNPAGEKLDYEFHPAKDQRLLAIIGHGVTANKDRAFLKALAENLVAENVSALRFSFAGNGASEGRFEDCSVSKELDDLRAVIRRMQSEYPWLAYIGHSMGGAVGLIHVSEHDDLDALVSLAGMVDVAGFAEREFGSETSGYMWGESDCPLSETYMSDCRQWGDLVDRAERVQVPWLLVHGTADDVVPPGDSRRAADRAPRYALLTEITDADHLFNGDAQELMLQAVVPWLSARAAELERAEKS